MKGTMWQTPAPMSDSSQGARKSIVILPADVPRIVRALEKWADDDIVALRTRAFVYLLWDGAVRTKTAVWLNIEEVVEDPRASRIQVVQEVVQRPCEGNDYKGRTFLMSDRTRRALVDYLKVARSGGWLAKADRLEGPLWISTHHIGIQARMSQRTAMQAWRTFLQGVSGVSEKYQLDDVVLTGRITFLRAAKGSTDALSEHSNISPKWAAQYREHLHDPSDRSNIREVISKINKQQKRKQS